MFCMLLTDTLIPNFTVYEMLLYTTELKATTLCTAADKQKKVDGVIEQLGLQSCRNTRIGAAHAGISGMHTQRSPHHFALIVRRLDHSTS